MKEVGAISALLAILLIATASLAACQRNCIRPKFLEIKTALERDIRVGDSKDQVANALGKNGISFGFDKFQNQYQSTIYDERCNPYQAVSLYIRFDEKAQVSKVEIFKSFTGL